MDAGAVRAVVERIEALPATIEGNREVLAWLRGERQGYDEAEAEARHRPARLVDFDAPAANALARAADMMIRCVAAVAETEARGMEIGRWLMK